jgi:hypothetical protein
MEFFLCVWRSSGMYIQYMQGPFQSRLGTAEYALLTTSSILLYYGSLDTWTVVHMTAAKFNPLIFSVSGFALSNAANISIFMILYGFCLLPAWVCHVIINIRNLESELMCASENWYWCGEPYFAGSAISIGGFRLKFPGGASISKNRSNQGFVESQFNVRAQSLTFE